MADASRDQNHVTTLLAVSSVDGVTPVTLWADPTTHRLLTDAASGLTGTGVANEIAYFTAPTVLASLATATYPSLAELSYVKGVTSSIQTQLNAKGVGDMVLASVQTNSGAKTFLDSTMLLRNVANTFSSKFTNTNLAARTYTLKDADGTLAFTSDLTGYLTAVSIATANGFSGSSSGGTTPALTIVAGALTPTSVSATSFLAATPATDTIAGVFRRNNGAQTSNIVEIQSEVNAFLAGFDKDGNLTSPKLIVSGTIELGHATQNTLSASGGVLSIEGNALAFASTVASKTAAIIYVIDGGGSAITTGSKGFLSVPAGYTITGWTLVADQSGSAVVDVKKSTYAGFPTTSTITGADKPTLSAVQNNQNLSVTLWTTAITAGDILEFNVDSATTVTRLTLTIVATKT